jgi:hypothetical protein
LMQLVGMGADQVIAMELVTAAGLFVTATPEINRYVNFVYATTYERYTLTPYTNVK